MRGRIAAAAAVGALLVACNGITVRLGDEPSVCSGPGPCIAEESECPEYGLEGTLCGQTFGDPNLARASELASFLEASRQVAELARSSRVELLQACDALDPNRRDAGTLDPSTADILTICAEAARSLPPGIKVRYTETISVCSKRACQPNSDPVCILSYSTVRVADLDPSNADLLPVLERWLPSVYQLLTDEGREKAFREAADQLSESLKRLLDAHPTKREGYCMALAQHDLDTTLYVELPRAVAAAKLVADKVTLVP